MQYKDYRDNIKLSRLGMGVMRLPVKDGNDALIDYEKAKVPRGWISPFYLKIIMRQRSEAHGVSAI